MRIKIYEMMQKGYYLIDMFICKDDLSRKMYKLDNNKSKHN